MEKTDSYQVKLSSYSHRWYLTYFHADRRSCGGMKFSMQRLKETCELGRRWIMPLSCLKFQKLYIYDAGEEGTLSDTTESSKIKTPSNAMSAVVVKYDNLRLHIACHRGEATTSHLWSVDFAVMKAVWQARRLLPRPIRAHFVLIRRDRPQYYLRKCVDNLFSIYVYDTSSCLELSNFVISY